ncbi:MAG: T9SS type A sorting domain-containing protein, partial [Flavobacteriales bacterium]|nr:T9SS type A sorting domain-containing protein [Flavobacteriales bacterium]
SIGLGAGIILGTGDIELAELPNASSGSSLPGSPDNYGDSDLESLTNVPVNDQIVLEFDFIALGDTVYMEYIFASEEYPEFECSSFNDVIGVFLDGPNPDGGDYVAENIALVPDPNAYGMTDDPVAINSVNSGSGAGSPQTCDEFAPDWMDYVVYYVSNEDTLYEYDGRTVVLNLLAPVTPGQAYHMKIGTGDGTDTAFDSAFLLGANSFKTAYSSVVGIEELENDLFEIYPNPVENILTIRNLFDQTNLKFELLDLQGRVLMSDALQSSQVELGKLPSGLYSLQILREEEVLHREQVSVK